MRTPLTILALGSACLLAVGGCASGDDPTTAPEATSGASASTTASSSATGSPSSDPSQITPGPNGATDLVISVDDGAGTITKHTLTCDPAGGDLPDAAAACKQLDDLGEDALKPVDPTMMCTQQFGGPQTATVIGSLQGQQVDAEFAMTDGCQIARWENHSALLGASVGADS